jgi:hypothetical protein
VVEITPSVQRLLHPRSEGIADRCAPNPLSMKNLEATAHGSPNMWGRFCVFGDRSMSFVAAGSGPCRETLAGLT